MPKKTEYINHEFRPFMIFRDYGFLLIINAALLLLYLFFVSSAVNQRIEADMPEKAISVTRLFSFLSVLASAISCAVKYRFSVNEYHIIYEKSIKDCKQDPEFSFFSYFFSYTKKNGWLSTVSYMMLILPGMLFYGYAKMSSGVGYSYEGGTFFDRLTVTSVFGPELTGSAFFGMLLDLALFFAVYIASVGIIQYAWFKKILK